ncbi:MAG: cation:proton antiporter, partial [Chloroflexi bacterium]|nr:cation:proton antiporter [Chloroflexota bacterium]
MIMDVALAIGVMIIVGFLGGRLAHRFKFPMITGYIIVGVLLSPSLLDIISGAAIDSLDIFTHLALGIIAYSIGGSLHWESIRRQERSILAIGTFQGVGALVLSTLAIA